MSWSKTKLTVIDSSHQEMECHIRYTNESPWRVRVNLSDGRTWDTEGPDLFAALRSARVDLEHAGFLLCCNGARPEARPSPTLSRSGAELIYLIPRWRYPTSRDIVPLFAYCEPAQVGSVASQGESKASLEWLRVLHFINPVAWWKSTQSRLWGPTIWISMKDSSGYVTWQRAK
jgi:hypothetical protein